MSAQTLRPDVRQHISMQARQAQGCHMLALVAVLSMAYFGLPPKLITPPPPESTCPKALVLLNLYNVLKVCMHSMY